MEHTRYVYDNFKSNPKKFMSIFYDFYIEVLYSKKDHITGLKWTDIDYVIAKYPKVNFNRWLYDKKIIIRYFDQENFTKIDIYSSTNNILATIRIHDISVSSSHLPRFFTNYPTFTSKMFITFIQNKVLKNKLEYLVTQ